MKKEREGIGASLKQNGYIRYRLDKINYYMSLINESSMIKLYIDRYEDTWQE